MIPGTIPNANKYEELGKRPSKHIPSAPEYTSVSEKSCH